MHLLAFYLLWALPKTLSKGLEIVYGPLFHEVNAFLMCTILRTEVVP